MKIKITCDSTADLSKELYEKYDIGVMPLIVSLGDNSYYDMVDIVPKDIYDYYEKTGALPKTAARSAYDYKEFFEQYTKQGYQVIHFNISGEMSATHNNAVTAAKELEGVYVIDSRTLSTGIGLLVLAACDLVKEGKMTAEQIYNAIEKRVPYTQASFIIGNMKFLYKGGRCTAVQMFGANLLKIKPSILVKNGTMGVYKKYMGSHVSAIEKYCKDMLQNFDCPDPTRVFVTHTEISQDIIDVAKKVLKDSGIFKEIIETEAGCTITSHCGKGTLGILYINDGKKFQK